MTFLVDAGEEAAQPIPSLLALFALLIDGLRHGLGLSPLSIQEVTAGNMNLKK
jgi:hypothetical protein